MAVMITNPELLLEILPVNNLIDRMWGWLLIVAFTIIVCCIFKHIALYCRRKDDRRHAEEAEKRAQKMKEQYAEFISAAAKDLTDLLTRHDGKLNFSNHFRITAEMHEAKITVEYGDRRHQENADDNKRINVVILSENDKITHKVRKIIDEA